MNELLLIAYLFFFGINGYTEQDLDNYLITLTPREFTRQIDDITTYNWSGEDIKYAALMAQTEFSGGGQDGMLSVLSTAYARFISPRWCQSYYCSKTILEEMQRPNQFIGPAVAVQMYGREGAYARIRPESYLAVYKFILGSRGSCSGDHGYEYFNSYPGGPVNCKIEMESGSFVEFFSTEPFSQTQEKGIYRNIQGELYRVMDLYSQPTKRGEYCRYDGEVYNRLHVNIC